MENKVAPRKRTIGHHFPRVLAILLLIAGIVTAALDLTLGGFTPIMWFLLALADLVITTCGEVLRIADFLESKK